MSNSSITEQKQELSSILELVTNMEFDEECIKGQELDEAKLLWYTERFDRCIEDGVPGAINCYLHKLQTEDVNEFTKICILHAALNAK